MKRIVLILFLGITTHVLAIKPEREYKWTPDMRGLKYQEYQVTTSDHFKINVWEYALPDSIKSDRTVILVGPDAGNMSFSIWQAMAFLDKGVRVIAFDYRGFGKSADFNINKDFLFYPEFALDLDSVIKATRAKFPKDKLGLYAMSMGTHISLLRREKIDFLVAEGFFNDPQRVAARFKDRGDTVLLPGKAKAVLKLKGKIPALIFCADNDKATTTEDAREFSKVNNAELIEFKGDHMRGMGVLRKNNYGDEYTERIIDFLKRNKL